MGKRLPKAALLLEIERERAALDDTLARLPAREMTKAGVTRAGWSVKDILAHLVEWQCMNLNWYAAGLRGEKPAIPAPGYTLRDLPRLNAAIYRKHHGRSLRAVMEDYRSHHDRVVDLIRRSSNADLVTLGRFSWTGPSWTLSDYLRAATAAHYLWARTRIRRWQRRHEGAGSEPRRRAARPTCKMIVVLYRRPDFTRQQFIAYLRDVHGPMAEALPGLVAYRQNYVVEDPARQDSGWDAVVELWWNERDSMEDAWRTAEGRAATGDLRAFVDLSRTTWSVVEECVRR